MTDEHRELIYAAASLHNGWHAVTAIDRDGVSWLWLTDDSNRDDIPGNGCREPCCAPHEQTGRLPRHVRLRIGQCAAIARTTRARCRNVVRAGERFCTAHGGSVVAVS